MRIQEQARCCKEFMSYVGGLDLVCSQCGTKIRLIQTVDEVIDVVRPTVLPPEGRTPDARFKFY